MRIRQVTSFGIVGFVAVIGIGSPAWAAVGPAAGIGAAPAPGSTQLAAGGGYFEPTLSPGASWNGSILVSNDEGIPTTISVYPADGLTAVNSGAVYSNLGQPLVGAGTWIHPASSSFVDAADHEATVGFTVDVPSSAVPGDHLGAIVAQASTSQQQSSGQFQVHVVARVVTAVLVRVPGPAAFSVDLGPASLRAPLDNIGKVVVPITDTGRLLGKPTLTVSLEQAGYDRTVVRQVDTLLPGGTAQFPVLWPDPLSGTYKIRACASGAGLPAPVCATKSASIAGPTATHVFTGPATRRSSISTLVIVLAAMSGALVVVAIVAALLLTPLLRRRSAAHAKGRRGSASRNGATARSGAGARHGAAAGNGEAARHGAAAGNGETARHGAAAGNGEAGSSVAASVNAGAATSDTGSVEASHFQWRRQEST